MIARVKTRNGRWNRERRRFDDAILPHETPCDDDIGIMFECEITDPPSSRGRTIRVYFPPEVVVETMKVFRDYGIRARSRPMGT